MTTLVTPTRLAVYDGDRRVASLDLDRRLDLLYAQNLQAEGVLALRALARGFQDLARRQKVYMPVPDEGRFYSTLKRSLTRLGARKEFEVWSLEVKDGK